MGTITDGSPAPRVSVRDGASELARAAAELGFGRVIGNPGTTELPLVRAFREHGIDYVLSLHENAATGVAFGMGWATGQAALVLLHATPGLAHGLGNVYNAMRSGVPMVVVAGQQDSRFMLQEPALSSRLTEVAAPVTKWTYQVGAIEELGDALRRAKHLAEASPQGPVFLSVPFDLLTRVLDRDASPSRPASACAPSTRLGPAANDSIDQAVELLLDADRPAIVLGDSCRSRAAHEPILEFARLVGAPMFTQPFMIRNLVPTSDPLYKGALGISARKIREKLERFDLLVSIAAPQIVPALYDEAGCIPPMRTVQLAESASQLGLSIPLDHAMVGDVEHTTHQMVQRLLQCAPTSKRNTWRSQREEVELGAERRRLTQISAVSGAEPDLDDAGALDLRAVVAAMSQVLPPETVVFDEGVSASGELIKGYPFSVPGTYAAGNRGGGIGLGIAAGVGLALAIRERPSVVFTGDGSALYTIQALWTAARYEAPVVVIVCNNSGYAILKAAMRANGVEEPADGDPELGISHPDVDFVALSEGFGVPAVRLSTIDELKSALRTALKRTGPSLIEIPTPRLLQYSPQH